MPVSSWGARPPSGTCQRVFRVRGSMLAAPAHSEQAPGCFAGQPKQTCLAEGVTGQERCFGAPGD